MKKITPGVRRIYCVYNNNTNDMYITSIFYLCNYLFILTKMSNCTLHNTHFNMHLLKKKIVKIPKKFKYKNKYKKEFIYNQLIGI